MNEGVAHPVWEDGEVLRRLAGGWKAEVDEGESGSLLRVSDIADKLESKAWSCRSLRVQQREETLQLSTFICVPSKRTQSCCAPRLPPHVGREGVSSVKEEWAPCTASSS